MDKRFKYAEGKRVELNRTQSRQIKAYYKQIANEMDYQIEHLKAQGEKSDSAKRIYLNNMSKELRDKISDIDGKTENLVKDSVYSMSNAVIQNNNMFLENFGFKGLTTNPKFTVEMSERIISGKLYDNKWSLSSAIWGDNKAKLNEINKIVSDGILKGRSTYEIAKDLQKYVNPSVRKDTEWSLNYPGTRRKIDYNAQRLARTMVQHAYQETFVAMTKNNPFITAYKWLTSGGGNVCQLCIDREENDEYGLGPGIFPKDALPLDHPNGQCTFEIVCPYSDDEIVEAIDHYYFEEDEDEMDEEIEYFINSIK